MKRISLLLISALFLTACSTYSTQRYATTASNNVTLRSFQGKTVNVGSFTSKDATNEIMCRQAGFIKAQDGEPLSEYVRKALIDELQMANIFSLSAPITITGRLENINFDSNIGTWDLALLIISSNGKSISVSEHYKYTTSFIGETACLQTAQALGAATQNIIGKLVKSKEFSELITPK